MATKEELRLQNVALKQQVKNLTRSISVLKKLVLSLSRQRNPNIDTTDDKPLLH